MRQGPNNAIWAIIQTWLDLQRFPPSQTKLGEAVGVGRSAVSDWKSGKTRPAPDTLRRLAVVMAPTMGRDVYAQLVVAMMKDMDFIPKELRPQEFELVRDAVREAIAEAEEADAPQSSPESQSGDSA